MNKILSLILIMLFLFSCKINNSQKNTINNSVTEDTLIYKRHHCKVIHFTNSDSIVATDCNGRSQLGFKFMVDTSGYLLKSIMVYSGNNPIQFIEAYKEILEKKFQLIDWNFDGYKDISVLYNCGTGGCAYWIWNYSTESKKFYYNNELSEKLGLEIDTTSKYIIFHYRAGFSEEWWDTLQYQHDSLTPVKGLYRERWNDLSGKSWVKNTRYKMIDNKPVITVDSSFIP